MSRTGSNEAPGTHGEPDSVPPEGRGEITGMLEQILQGVSDGILLLSRDFRVLWANRAMLDAMGLNMEEARGRHCYKIISARGTPCRPPGDGCPIERTQRTGRLVRVRRTHFDRDGNGAFVEVWGYPIRDEKGEILRYVHVSRDLTYLKRAYGVLQSLDRLKIDIISNLSHELRTPLTVAQGSIELCLTNLHRGSKEDLLTKALDALERQNQIIENLITVSHIYADNIDMSPSLLDVSSLVEDAVEAVRGEADHRSIRMILRTEEDLPGIVADWTKLRLAFTNILENAVKFNKAGGRVEVSLECSGKDILVSVADQGIGVPEEERERIFLPLTQLDPSIRRKYPGTGTGLAVAKHIINLHGGRIWVEDNPEGGSIFFVSLPREKGS
jgi:PAS domain S-box-containing protein